jgi:SAM-dependent methyltransferase
MVPQTTADIRELLAGYLTAGALAAALERGLFWHLDDRPETSAAVAGRYVLPERRCGYWLEVLSGLGLLDRDDGTYRTSETARTLIMKAYSPSTWALLAEEVRERYRAGSRLVEQLDRQGSVWDDQDDAPPDYVAQMATNQERARRFAQALHEIHTPLAEEVARALDLADADRLLDVGGGSGVMAMGLLRRHPRLTATVVDIPTVCVAGREIAAETPLADRVTYVPGDFLTEALPNGFDVALLCDVGHYEVELLAKVARALLPGGRLVVVDRFPVTDTPGLSLWDARVALFEALADPGFAPLTRPVLRQRLAAAEFTSMRELGLGGGATLVDAVRGG